MFKKTFITIKFYYYFQECVCVCVPLAAHSNPKFNYNNIMN